MTSDLPIMRFRFETPGDGSNSHRRRFHDPRPTVVVEAILDVPLSDVGPSLPNELLIARIPTNQAKTEAAFLAGTSEPDAPLVVVKSGTVTIRWRPGRAVVIGPPEATDEAVNALIDVAFYEGELRRLEALVAAFNDEAEADIELAFHVKDVTHRDRFADRIANYTRIRLTFARLEPHLIAPGRNGSPAQRVWVRKLLRRVDAEARAEALSDILETREELYEGAVDRMTDFWGWRQGHKLEVIIIALLLLEVVAMALEVILRLQDGS